jgi:hypothetical protein
MLGLAPRITLLRDVPAGNGNWLAERPGGERVVRRHDALTTRAALSYEHAVLRHLAAAGWTVPGPVGDLIQHEGRCYRLTPSCPARRSPTRIPASSAAAAVTWPACTWPARRADQ